MVAVQELYVSLEWTTILALHVTGPAWRHSRREFLANLGPADLEAYQPLEKHAVHCLLRNLLSSPDNFAQHLRHMAGQVILSIAYGIDVLPENDPYVIDAENEALLLDSIPWCIYCHLIWTPETDI
ncbi:hypothetical protein EDB89DRAFT_2034081 [Lactarius sanguifluus]|nr:hypothetical protein EDB89DRAFT_2034081 [Lactarius sanguifluus]